MFIWNDDALALSCNGHQNKDDEKKVEEREILICFSLFLRFPEIFFSFISLPFFHFSNWKTVTDAPRNWEQLFLATLNGRNEILEPTAKKNLRSLVSELNAEKLGWANFPYSVHLIPLPPSLDPVKYDSPSSGCVRKRYSEMAPDSEVISSVKMMDPLFPETHSVFRRNKIRAQKRASVKDDQA